MIFLINDSKKFSNIMYITDFQTLYNDWKKKYNLKAFYSHPLV